YEMQRTCVPFLAAINNMIHLKHLTIDILDFGLPNIGNVITNIYDDEPVKLPVLSQATQLAEFNIGIPYNLLSLVHSFTEASQQNPLALQSIRPYLLTFDPLKFVRQVGAQFAAEKIKHLA